MDGGYETVLLIIRECFVYRIPPRTTSRGYKAADWDVNGFMWKGRLRIVATGNQATIKLEDPNTGELFAACPYQPEKNSVEPVVDSSRYFVVRVEDKGKHAFLGLGFQERTDAFDFNVALQDFLKQNLAEKEATEAAKAADEAPKVDYSLKEGEQISISIGNVTKRGPRPHSAQKTEAVGGSPASSTTPVLLPPPPSAATVKNQMKTSSKPGAGGTKTDQFLKPLGRQQEEQQQQQQQGAQTNAANGSGSVFGGFTSASSANAGWTSFQ